MPNHHNKYNRILLKLSGEALMGEKEFGLDPQIVARIAQEIANVHQLGIEICIVIGGGNMFRGMSASQQGIERVTADHIGMLGTVMNGLAMQSALEKINISTRVQSAISMDTVCEPFIRRRALRHMEKKRVVIIVAGTGNPYFTTDSAAALRASEMNCDVLLKATKVNGVYDKDPMQYDDAVRYDKISFQDVLQKDLKIMDTSAMSICRDNNIPIIVFSLWDHGMFENIMLGQGDFTYVH